MLYINQQESSTVLLNEDNDREASVNIVVFGEVHRHHRSVENRFNSGGTEEFIW